MESQVAVIVAFALRICKGCKGTRCSEVSNCTASKLIVIAGFNALLTPGQRPLPLQKQRSVKTNIHCLVPTLGRHSSAMMSRLTHQL